MERHVNLEYVSDLGVLKSTDFMLERVMGFFIFSIFRETWDDPWIEYPRYWSFTHRNVKNEIMHQKNHGF